MPGYRANFSARRAVCKHDREKEFPRRVSAEFAGGNQASRVSPISSSPPTASPTIHVNAQDHPTAYFALADVEAASPAAFAASATRTVVPLTSESAGFRMTRSVGANPVQDLDGRPEVAAQGDAAQFDFVIRAHHTHLRALGAEEQRIGGQGQARGPLWLP